MPSSMKTELFENGFESAWRQRGRIHWISVEARAKTNVFKNADGMNTIMRSECVVFPNFR